jgi:hypothetical protein
MPFTADQLTELFKAGPVALFAAVVWYEVHEIRTVLVNLSNAIAVLADRAGK